MTKDDGDGPDILVTFEPIREDNLGPGPLTTKERTHSSLGKTLTLLKFGEGRTAKATTFANKEDQTTVTNTTTIDDYLTTREGSKNSSESDGDTKATVEVENGEDRSDKPKIPRFDAPSPDTNTLKTNGSEAPKVPKDRKLKAKASASIAYNEIEHSTKVADTGTNGHASKDLELVESKKVTPITVDGEIHT